MASSFLDLYEPLDIIGNGSFGVIRKVRRKSDGLIFARKELNFERMSERDRKQIVAEVNILKDLHHDHIVRYHDRYVDRDAGILYILMEYCGGGDLSTVIKQSSKHNRPISEDTIWNYFLQILLALHHCHHPNSHGRSGSGTSANGGALEAEGSDRRTQILHRDLKPDNVFLDDAHTVKLGDFGLSKALAQASFANTYVGTPYYMSPELMQEKSYDSKSDIWSLGCLIYELCALKPPFHEAKTHSELSICIRNGRIPPLPRGYSQALSSVIKSMLSLNPAMRPSTVQLLQHERLELVFKVAETEKMLTTVKNHKSTVAAKEREILARETAIIEKEQHLGSVIALKDNEIATLQQMVGQLQQQQQQFSGIDVEATIKEAVGRREEELRVLVMKREREVAEAIAKREEEIMEAVRQREVELFEAWNAREIEMCQEVDEKFREIEEQVEWIRVKEEELKTEDSRLEGVRIELEDKVAKWEDSMAKGRKEKTPLEEVKNLLAPLVRMAHDEPSHRRKVEVIPTPKPAPSPHPFPSLATPVSRPVKGDFMPSAMKGVVLTATGETLATPTPAELANLFSNSPKVGLNFTKIFDFGDGDDDEDSGSKAGTIIEQEHSPPPSPSSRKSRERVKSKGRERVCKPSTSETPSASTSALTAAPPTRLRRPSIRSSANHPPSIKAATLPSSVSDPTGLSTPNASSSHVQPKPLPHPHLNAQRTVARSVTLPIPVPRSHPPPEYDLADEENLPSPFLKRTVERTVSSASISMRGNKKRLSNGNTLRAVAAANAAGKRVSALTAVTPPSAGSVDNESSPVTIDTRPSLASARKASEEARKALLRP